MDCGNGLLTVCVMNSVRSGTRRGLGLSILSLIKDRPLRLRRPIDFFAPEQQTKHRIFERTADVFNF